MESPIYYVFLALFALCLVFFNCLISKDIHEWIPSIRKQTGLYLLVWLLPVIGFYLANKLGNLGWFTHQRSENGNSVISGGLFEMDSFFNPGAKHSIEVIEKQKSGLYQQNKQSDDENKNK